MLDDRLPLILTLTPGHWGDAPWGRWLLERLGPISGRPQLLADRADEGDAMRALAAALGWELVTPPKANRLKPWPLFASSEDVIDLSPTTISVNECDPLRDEGIAIYHVLLESGVAARCRQVMGTIHGTEVFHVTCPDISRDTARDLAVLAKGRQTGRNESSSS